MSMSIHFLIYNGPNGNFTGGEIYFYGISQYYFSILFFQYYFYIIYFKTNPIIYFIKSNLVHKNLHVKWILLPILFTYV